MPDQKPSRRPLILIADAHEWSARLLVSILAAGGYEVLEVHTGAAVLGAVSVRQPDAIVLDEALPEIDVLILVQALRGESRVPAETPIILAAAGPAARPLRVAALRAGATDVWGLPMNTDELLLRLEVQLRAKFAAEGAREEGLVDWATGLYNHRGLSRRARDLASQATRRRAPLACVVFAPDLPSGAAHDGLNAAIAAVALGLKEAGRASDAIGRLGPREFAVLAPDTDPEGALQLGNRLKAAIERAGAARPSVHRLQLRAGYHGVDDFHAAGLDPLDLLEHATSALRTAEAGGSGWISSFQSGLRAS
jgi:diguanylate cyclase (GGDEF)-like protein